MIFISTDGTFVNTSPQNPYFHKVLEFRELWLSGKQNFLIQTSGSTGIPKQISLTRRQILASVRMTQKAFDLKQGDTAFCCLNFEYIAGMMMLVRAIEIGMDLIVVEPSSNPFESLGNQQYLLNASKQKNFFAFVPLQMEQIVENPLLNSAKAIIIGGANISNNLLGKIQNIYSPVYATYGMTETVSHIAIKRLNGIENSTNFEVLEGVLIDVDERNCLKIKSETTQNQWISTNDVVDLVDEKHFALIGRIDNVINSGGVKIHSEKVEKMIEAELQKIQFDGRFFCFGIEDEKLGQKLILVIENENHFIEIESFTESLKEKMSKFEVPKSIYFVPKFIETPTGKINKNQTVNEYIFNQISNG